MKKEAGQPGSDLSCIASQNSSYQLAVIAAPRRASCSIPGSYACSQARTLSCRTEDLMDDKTLTAISTSLALMQIQVNALLLLLERHTPDAPIKDDSQRLIGEGVETVSLERCRALKIGFEKESFKLI